MYAKPNAPRRRRSKRGAKNGPRGHHRDRPLEIHRQREPRCPVCPECGGPLQRCDRKRTRLIEDLPEGLHAEVTEHTIWRDYCPTCKKDVEPLVAEAVLRRLIRDAIRLRKRLDFSPPRYTRRKHGT